MKSLNLASLGSIRQKLGLTPEKLSELSGVSVETIISAEAGSKLTRDSYAKLATAVRRLLNDLHGR